MTFPTYRQPPPQTNWPALSAAILVVAVVFGWWHASVVLAVLVFPLFMAYATLLIFAVRIANWIVGRWR